MKPAAVVLGTMAVLAMLGTAIAVGNAHIKLDKAMAEMRETKAMVGEVKASLGRVHEKLDYLRGGLEEVGYLTSSWYGEVHAGRLVAAAAHKSDKVPKHLWRFDPEQMTCAHRTEPFGTILRCRLGDREVDVMVTDRGPAEWTNRDLDLSRAAAERLGFKRAGEAKLRVWRVKL